MTPLQCKTIREAMGWSIHDAADLALCDPARLLHFETFGTQYPDAETERLVRALYRLHDWTIPKEGEPRRDARALQETLRSKAGALRVAVLVGKNRDAVSNVIREYGHHAVIDVEADVAIVDRADAISLFECPVVMLLGKCTQAAVADALAAGAAEVVGVPFDGLDLMARVQSHADNARSLAADGLPKGKLATGPVMEGAAVKTA